jgi:ribosomal protein S18 acetylase RimI-like enzyme
MREGVIINPCTTEDLRTLTAIAKQTFTETFGHLNDPKHFDPYVNKAFTMDKITSEFNNPDSLFFFIHYQNELAGYLKLNFNEAQSDIRDSQSMEIERIYLLNAFQGLGLGTALFEYSLSIAKNRPFKYLWLGVWEKNSKAINFYESKGFYKFAKHPFKLGDDLQSDYLMRLDL